MNPRTIEVIVGPSGELKIEAVGFTGSDCEQATAFLEQALGEVRQRSRKPEYHRRAHREQRIGL